MSTSRPELDADALDLLAAFRNEEQIPASVHDRVWERVGSDVATASSSAAAARWGRRGAALGLLAAAAAAVLWIGRSAQGVPDAPLRPTQARYEHPRPTTDGSARARPRARVEAAAASGALETDAAGSPTSGLADEPEAGPDDPTTARPATPRTRHRDGARQTSPARPTPPTSRDDDPVDSVDSDDPVDSVDPDASDPGDPPRPPSDTLAEENRLLTRARAELIAERPEQALAVLREHARRFARGVLAQERDALHAIALCEAGLDAQGIPAARAFLRAHPGAALAPRVRAACLP